MKKDVEQLELVELLDVLKETDEWNEFDFVEDKAYESSIGRWLRGRLRSRNLLLNDEFKDDGLLMTGNDSDGRE